MIIMVVWLIGHPYYTEDYNTLLHLTFSGLMSDYFCINSLIKHVVYPTLLIDNMAFVCSFTSLSYNLY